MPGVADAQNAREFWVELTNINTCCTIVRNHPVGSLSSALPQKNSWASRVADHEVVNRRSPICTAHEHACSIIQRCCRTRSSIAVKFDAIEDGRGSNHVGLEADCGIVLDERIGDSYSARVDFKSRVPKAGSLCSGASSASQL